MKKASKKITKLSDKRPADAGWHKKIASRRGESWRKNTVKGRMDAIANPSLIRIARMRAGLDQTTVAGLINVSVSTFGAIERARQLVKSDKAEKIAKAVSAPIKKLFKENKRGKFLAIVRRASL